MRRALRISLRDLRPAGAWLVPSLVETPPAPAAALPVRDQGPTLAGLRVGTWTAICTSRAVTDEPLWRCACACGTRRAFFVSALLAGRVPKCSCIDLTGKRFGRWVVLRRAGRSSGARLWWCRCACGREKPVRGMHLAGGKTLSCGCGKRRSDLAGQRVGSWTVLAYAGGSHVAWHCRCDCGTERPVVGHDLRNGCSLSCGCRTGRGRLGGAFRDLTGKRFGRWQVVESAGKADDGTTLLWCVCDCGYRARVRRNVLCRGESRSCGCVRRKRPGTFREAAE